MNDLLRKLIVREEGQDILEYALLTASIGLAGAATWPLVSQALGTAYSTLDSQTQNLWAPPNPAGAGS
jgi:Flp pilus assembly pilin Flp